MFGGLSPVGRNENAPRSTTEHLKLCYNKCHMKSEEIQVQSRVDSVSSLSPRRRDALMAIEEIRADRIARNEREWTLDEINAEIAAARSDRRKRAADGAMP